MPVNGGTTAGSGASQPSDRKRPRAEPKGEARANVDLGFGGVLKGIGSLVELLGDMAREGKSEVVREGEIGGEGVRAVYGFTVRMGPGGSPSFERFGNVKETREEGPVIEEIREPLIDVFDEDEAVVVVAELPGIDEENVELDVEGDVLVLAATTGSRKYRKEILLPAGVEAEPEHSRYRNGILELRFRKRAQ